MSAKRYALDRGDYYQLRTLLREAELAKLEAANIHARAQAFFEQMAKQYAFDPTAVYRWEDSSTTLIPAETTSHDD